MSACSNLFARLEREASLLMRRSPAELEAAVADAIRVKLRFSGSDERDAGRRAALNFGHTVAHAIEAVSGFTVSHGQAVAIGVVAEGRIARELGRLSAGALARIETLLVRFGLPVRLSDALR